MTQTVSREAVLLRVRGQGSLRFQFPPVEPCMRFSRTRLTDAVHRLAFGVTRQARKGLGAATIPSRPISPRWFGDWKYTTERPKAWVRLCRLLITSASVLRRKFASIAAREIRGSRR